MTRSTLVCIYIYMNISIYIYMYISLYSITMIWILLLQYLITVHSSLTKSTQFQWNNSLSYRHNLHNRYTNISTDIIYHTYPVLSQEVIWHGLSPHGYRGNLSLLNHAFKRATLEKKLNIVVLGGSVPHGVSIRPPAKRWSDSLQDLTSVFPQNIAVNVTNLAIPACHSMAQAQSHFPVFSPYLSKAHVVVVDITVNDRSKSGIFHANDEENYDGRILMDLLLKFTNESTGIIYFETYSSQWYDYPLVRKASEIDQCSFKNKTIKINKKSRLTIRRECPIDVASAFHWCPLLQLKIPLISYANIAAQFCGRGHRDKYYYRNAALGLWDTLTFHPPPKSHRFISHVLYFSLLELYGCALYNECMHFSSEQDINWQKYVESASSPINTTPSDWKCLVTPTSYMSVHDSHTFVPLKHGPDWFYGEDVAGKPGWLILPNAKSLPTRRKIVFNVTTTLNYGVGSVKLEVLHSYSSDMGTLTCGIVDETTGKLTSKVLIETLQSDHTSQGFIWRLPVNEKDKSSVETSKVAYLVQCIDDKRKAKLLSVIGC